MVACGRQGGQHCCRASEGMNEIVRAAWYHAHRCSQVSGRLKLHQSLRRAGERAGLDRALRRARHANCDLQVIGGPPPHAERSQRAGGGAGRRHRVASRFWRATFGGADGPPPPTAPFQMRYGGLSRTTRYLVGSLPELAGLVGAHHYAQCFLRGGGSSVRRFGPRCGPPHRARTRPIDGAPIVVTHATITPIAGPRPRCSPVPPPRRPRCGRTFSVIGSRRTICAPASYCLLRFYHHHPRLFPSSTKTFPPSPATPPFAVDVCIGGIGVHAPSSRIPSHGPRRPRKLAAAGGSFCRPRRSPKRPPASSWTLTRPGSRAQPICYPRTTALSLAPLCNRT